MASNDFDSEATLAFFRQLGNEIDNLKGKIGGLNEAGGSGMKKLADETERFGQNLTRHTRTMHSMREESTSLLRTLVGPVGLAAAFVGVAKSLDNFAVGELRLRNFAMNTGFTVESVNKLTLQLRAAGIEAGEASGQIGAIGGKLQSVLTHQQASPFYQQIASTNPALAEHIRLLMNQGKQQEALNAIQEAYNRGGQRYKQFLIDLTGFSRASFEAQKIGIEGLIQPWEVLPGQAAKYHRSMLNLETAFNNVWKSMSETMIDEINKMIGGEDKLDANTKKISDKINTFIKDTLNPDPEKEAKKFQEWQDNLNKLAGLPAEWSRGKIAESEKSGFLHDLNAPFVKAHDAISRFFSQGIEADKTGALGSLELTETEKDSNRLLGDIRDSLLRMENPSMGGGEGSLGTGIRTPGGSMQGGLGGFRGTRGGESSGPTPGSIGALSGMVHGHQVDPYGGLTGQKLFEPMTATSLGGGVGGTSHAFGARSHEGVDIMGPVGSATYSPMEGTVTNIGRDSYGNQTITVQHANGIYSRFLHQRGVNVKVGDKVGGGQQVGTSGFANQAHTHFEMWKGRPSGTGSSLLNPRALFGWDKNNLPQGGREVTGHGASPTSYQSGEGRGSTFDDKVTASGLPSYIPGIALPTREGLGQTFKVTTPDGRTFMAKQTDVGPSSWTGRSIDINAPLARAMGYKGAGDFPTDQPFKWEQMRGAVDKGLRGLSGGDLGGAHISVDFNGMPKGVKTNGELMDSGIFKTLKINRSPQAPQPGGITTDYNRFSFE